MKEFVETVSKVCAWRILFSSHKSKSIQQRKCLWREQEKKSGLGDCLCFDLELRPKCRSSRWEIKSGRIFIMGDPGCMYELPLVAVGNWSFTNGDSGPASACQLTTNPLVKETLVDCWRYERPNGGVPRVQHKGSRHSVRCLPRSTGGEARLTLDGDNGTWSSATTKGTPQTLGVEMRWWLSPGHVGPQCDVKYHNQRSWQDKWSSGLPSVVG